MPEIDFIQKQLLNADKRSFSEKLRDRVLLGLLLSGIFALFLIGLSIERALILVIFILAIGVAAYGWKRQQKFAFWFKDLLKKNKRFTSLYVVILLIGFPFFFLHNPYIIHLAALCGISIIMALGLNISLGFAGLLDLGFAAYFAAGAYTSAQLSTQFGINFWIALPLAGIAASFFGFLVSWPSLRVHEQYLALVTLGYGLIMNLLHRNLKFLTGGTDGIINIPPPSIWGFKFTDALKLGGWEIPFQTNFYYLALGLAGLTFWVSLRIRESRVGRALEAVREDEIAGKCFGINLTSTKVLAFSTGAFFGGIGGSVYAHMIGIVHPDNFGFMVSMTILCMVVVGGMGNLSGVMLGAIFLTMVPERLREFEKLRLLLFALSLLFLMLYRPEGIFPNLRRKREMQAEKLYELIERSGLEDMEKKAQQDGKAG